jgi:hypothetical protein
MTISAQDYTLTGTSTMCASSHDKPQPSTSLSSQTLATLVEIFERGDVQLGVSKFAHNPSYPDKVWFVSLELGRGHGATLAEALTMAQAEQTKRKAEIAQNFVPNAAYPYRPRLLGFVFLNLSHTS